jgi:hypothetical protein
MVGKQPALGAISFFARHRRDVEGVVGGLLIVGALQLCPGDQLDIPDRRAYDSR